MGADEPTCVTGLVSDTNGRAIEGVRVNHTGKPPMSYLTDHNGRFELCTTAPAIVFRKVGFRSQRAQVAEKGSWKVVLAQSAPLSRRPRDCGAIATSATKSKDSDYEAMNVAIETVDGTGRVICGRGPNWTTGVPPDEVVWESIEFREEVYGQTGFGWVDSRGRTKNGTFWRFVGTLGESCYYAGASSTLVPPMDCVVDKMSGTQ